MTRTDASTPGFLTRSSAAPEPRYKTWLKTNPRDSPPPSNRPRWIRSVATVTLSATSCRRGRGPRRLQVVRLGTHVVDEVRRRVQQDTTLGHRGQKHDPLFQIRGLLRQRCGASVRTPAGQAHPVWRPATPTANSMWPGSVTNNSAPSTRHHHRRSTDRGEADRWLPVLPDPEVAWLGRTLNAWRQTTAAYFDTSGVSNGAIEAINLIIEKVRRLAHGFRDFTHNRLRILLAAPGNRAYRK
jgi:transposase